MSSESDSEVFFDAEESTPVRSSTKSPNKEEKLKKLDEAYGEDSEENINVPTLSVNQENIKEAAQKAKEDEQRRRRVEEMRKIVLNEEDEAQDNRSERSSLASSSVDGIYPSNRISTASKTSNPNNIETSSVVSLGRVGHILGGREPQEPDNLSSNSKYSTHNEESLNSFAAATSSVSSSCSAEPDLVASTKVEPKHPVPPPRRKRKKKDSDTISLPLSNSSTLSQVELPSPTDPVESIAREIEYSLDLHSASRGQYVVKPQDREQDRAAGPNGESSTHPPILQRSESFDAISSSLLLQSTSEKLECSKGDKQQQPYMVRTRSDSGRPLTDAEILAQVTVRNLDTGEQIPLNLAEEHLPKCLNPLSLHIMRLTSEYVSSTDLDKESDEENAEASKSASLDMRPKAWERTFSFRRGLGRRLKMEVSKIRTVVVDKVTHAKHGDEDNSEEEMLADQKSSVKIKMSSKLKSHEKGKSEFENIRVLQELNGEHTGAIWTMKFSTCGRLLATAGQDHDLRIWVLKDAFPYFDDMRKKYNAKNRKNTDPPMDVKLEEEKIEDESVKEDAEEDKGPFMPKPFCKYRGHTAELLDISWSKNDFILSSSMDKTVRLWHISREECLCCFQHIDFVTAIVFHPKDDRYFLSGSLDGKLRLWYIPDRKVTLWNELDGQTKLITAVNFCQNGKMAVVGSYDGRCIFYYTDHLKYYTQIHVRSTKGKNAQGRKISGIEEMPGENKILVTSNDSRIRLYDFRDLSLTCKYKGYVNLSSQIKASFSHDGEYVLSGSENQFIYVWKTSHDYAKLRRDRNDYWTGIKAHNAQVTSAVFAPNPASIVKQLEKDLPEDELEQQNSKHKYYIVVSADFNGIIKVFLHKTKIGSTSAN